LPFKYSPQAKVPWAFCANFRMGLSAAAGDFTESVSPDRSGFCVSPEQPARSARETTRVRASVAPELFCRPFDFTAEP